MARNDLLARLLDSDGNPIGEVYGTLSSGTEPPDEEPPDEEPPDGELPDEEPPDEEQPDEGSGEEPTAPEPGLIDPSDIDVPAGETMTVGRDGLMTVSSPSVIAGAIEISGELRLRQ